MANPYRHYNSGEPYYDDFDPKKNYMKVLYRPGVAVQARELTQSQTYLNNQLAALGGYFFKDGTPIDGAKISFSTKQPVMQIDFSFNFDNVEDAEKYIESYLVGNTFEGESSNQFILITDYYIEEVKDNTDNNVEVTYYNYYLLFSYYGSILVDGETFTGSTDDGYAQLTFNMIGRPFTSLVAACSEGTIFVDGYFVYVPKSTRNVILSINNENSTGKEYHIGFDIERNIMTSNEDTSLNDNALGSYNYKAPGAHRWQINAVLAGYEKNELPSNNDDAEISFVPGIVIKDGILIQDQPSELDGNLSDLLARRTYEESGSYTVNPWKIQIKDNLEDTSKYIVSIEPGMGYIYGYRVSNLVSQDLEVNKPREFISKTGNTDYITDAIYTYANFESDDNSTYAVNTLQAHKFPDFLRMEEVYVMSSLGGDGYNAGNVLGVCRITDVYKQGNYFILYLTDISDVVGSFGSAKSFISKADVDNKVTEPRYVNLRLNEDGSADLYGTDNPKIIQTGYSMVTPYVKDKDGKILNYSANSIEYNFLSYFDVSASDDGSFIQLKEIKRSTPVDTTGLIYIYEKSSGNHIDVTNLQVLQDTSGETPTIHAIIKHQDNKVIFEAGQNYIVCIRSKIENSSFREKTVEVITETFTVTNENEVQLSQEDIIDIVSVTTTNNNTTIECKDKVILDNGQRDYLYDYGSVSGFNKIHSDLKDSSNDTERVFTITYRYYIHSTDMGPFVASSYIDTDGYNASKLLSNTGNVDELNNILYTQIPTYRSKATNKVYKLRDCLDFRVKRSLITSSTTNFPNSRTSISYDLGIFLPRIDAVWVDKNGNFGVTEGIPSQTPEPPEEKDGVMTIYYLYNEAFGENVNVKYINNQRHTMSEITELENRITNVENVLSLSMLEQSAVNMQITDDEGLNRYKTGIFTDNFSSYDNSDFTNEEWNASIDAVECSLRPLYECEEHGFVLGETSNTESMDDVVLTLKPTTTEIFAKNDALSEATNIQSLMFYVWTGSLKLTPSIDTWVTDLGNILVSETWVETPKPPTAYRTWSVSTTTDVKTSTKTSTSTQRRNANDGWGSYWTDTYRTTATTKTATIQTKTTTETTSYTGSWTTSNVYTQMESQDTYMRVREIEYSLKGMRPGMTIHARMDGVDITDKLSDRVIKSDGTLVGTFTIPEKMTVGTKLVEFYDNENTSAADAEYTANGKTVWTNVDRTYLRTWTALISTDTQTSYSMKDLGTTTNTTKVSSVYRNLDPIAESFYVDSPNGIMLESIDLFFAKKDATVNVDVIVVECENGYPSQIMVPFSRVSKKPDDVKIIGTKELEYIKNETKNLDDYATNFKFDSPIYLSPETEYAFIVIAPSYNYEIYTSTLGKADLISGIGIKEQPYIGSMFKSQNLRTWSAEQLSDITFRIHKYKFANTTGSAKFVLKTLDKDFESTMQTLALNTFVPNQTNINYSYCWVERGTVNREYIPFNNKNDIFNTEKKLISSSGNAGTVSLEIKCDISTLDENISPMIDLEQIYGIFTNNIVNDKSDNELISNNLVPFKENGIRDTATKGKYNFYCGTYISNPVTLENAGEDLRVILDAILPNSSDIKVSFKTTTYNPLYVMQGKKGYCISESEVMNSIGKTMQMYWYNHTNAQLENPDGIDSSAVPTKCIITGYTDDKVYIRSISDQKYFKDYDEVDEDGNEIITNNVATNYNAIYLLPILNENIIDCPIWDLDHKYTENTETIEGYPEGSYVMWDKCIWRANRKAGKTNTPSEYSIVWDKVSGIKVVSEVKTDDTVVWRPMTSEVIDINTTRTSSSMSTEENFKEYTYYPELEIESDFTDFVIRIDLYSQDEVNVPRVKNLRAIALV